ncbi:MAG TPA: S-layer homology domain-containing protein [Thermoanaerobaculia bacterium]|nr:S-layer homology domain-containing protein [Thermoanaerobaculia bacterium]
MFASLASGAGSALLGICGPFTDVAADVFCPFVLEIFYLGITTGTTATTYDPASNVSRLQMAAFLSRTVDGALKRGSRRAALDQFWTTQNSTVMGLTTVGLDPVLLASDGADIWVANHGEATVSRVRASDGKLLETWTGATQAWAVLSAMGRIFVTGDDNPGKLYRIDPSAPAGVVTTVASNLGVNSEGIAFDGTRIWVTNISDASVSIVTPGPTIPWTATTLTTVTTGIGSPGGLVFDGSNIWIANNSKLEKVDPGGTVLQTVTLGSAGAGYPVFDGSNIWVPIATTNRIAVVRASSGALLATLTGNGLGDAHAAAFDGQRVAVTSISSATLSLWKAADLTPISSLSLPIENPRGVCSDGINFWVTLNTGRSILRF